MVYFENEWAVLHHGDCVEVMAAMDENSKDAIVTDPPYGLEFMGKEFDKLGDGPAMQAWHYRWAVEALCVLKPGGHLLAFGGTRTSHRLVCALEDAGFEVRDTVMWVYGSGFPKSLDVSRAIDQHLGAEREVVGMRNAHRDGSIRTPFVYGGIAGEGKQGLAGKKCGGLSPVTAPATEAAKTWEGWRTALKPSHEPIVLCRKPLSEPTVAANVLRWGTGALNIAACRVGTETITAHGGGRVGNRIYGMGNGIPPIEAGSNPHQGRWPSNFIHDGSDEVLSLFPETTSGKFTMRKTTIRGDDGNKWNSVKTDYKITGCQGGDSGSAARFFYCAKASGSDRGNHTKTAAPLFGEPEETFTNGHPTVKPVALVRYLVRLITPPGGVVLDQFFGSGTTGVAAIEEGFEVVGIEQEEEYCEIAACRLSGAKMEFA